MSNEFGHERPELKLENKLQRQEMWRDGLLFDGNISENERSTAYKVVQVAQKIAPRVCDLPGNEGNKGFMIGITKREPGFPILIVQIGDVNKDDQLYGNDGKRGKFSEFARLKAQMLQAKPEMISSFENLSRPEEQRTKSSKNIEISGGAIVANSDWIITTSAFKNPGMDTATSLAIATGAGLIGIDKAEDLAHNDKLNCKHEFMTMVDIVVEEVLH